MAYRFIVLAGMAILCLAGCSDRKAASKSNFLAALQKWFDAHPECVSIGPSDALTVQANDVAGSNRIPDALARAGLLTREAGFETSRGWNGSAERYKVVRYHPTATAGDAIRKADTRFIGGTDLCFAHRQIEEITGFTEPADIMGVRVSQVDYQFRLRDVAPWANDPNLRAVLPSLSGRVARLKGHDKAELVLTNDGWSHEPTQ